MAKRGAVNAVRQTDCLLPPRAVPLVAQAPRLQAFRKQAGRLRYTAALLRE